MTRRASEAQSKQAKKRSLRAVNEHFEPVFNAVSATQVVFQRPASAPASPADNNAPAASTLTQPRQGFSLRRLRAVAVREGKELRRDPVRLAFALLGSVFMMVIFGYGISLDVENLRFAAFDQDNSPQSRSYLEAFRGSRYFEEHPPISSPQELHQRLQRSEIKIVLEVPPGFGRDLYAGRQPQPQLNVDATAMSRFRKSLAA